VVFAATEGLPELMAALVARGRVKLDVFDSSGMTPLQTAAFKGDADMVCGWAGLGMMCVMTALCGMLGNACVRK
jgi:hypothetical protein